MASRSRPRPIRGEFPRQQDRRGPAAAADGGRPQGHWRFCCWRPATAARRDRRLAGALPRRIPAAAAESRRPSGPNVCGRAPPDHGDVLRSRRLDESRREARRRGLAQPRQRLSRRGVGGGDRAWRPRAEEARRRADGAVRLSARAGERRRARGARRARDPARACRNQRQKRQQRRARSFRARIGLDSGQVVVDATGEVFGEAPNIAARVQAPPSRARSSSQPPSNGRPPDCSWPRTAANTSSRECRRR